ncbi:MAG: FAD-binding oxidoreductase [Thermomicrobiales bacterium]
MTRSSRRVMLRSASAIIASLAVTQHRPAAAQTPVASDALRDLQQRLAGALLLPGDERYLAASIPANRRYQDVMPAAIAGCADDDDVITCVKWCVENGVALVARGGGHSYAGYSTTSGLQIDLRGLSSVEVDRATGTMTVGGGATTSQILTSLQDGPLFLPSGTCPSVGIGGLTLGGGLGYDTRWAGLTCDHLQQTTVVSARGESIDASANQRADLFWALRGGAGGSFGVNTSFTFELVDVPPAPVTSFSVVWRGADAANLVISAFQDIMQQAPAELGARVVVIPEDPAASGRRRAIRVSLEGHYVGSASDLQDLLRPLLQVKTPPVEQTIEEMPFWQSQQRLLEPVVPASAFTDFSRYADAPLPNDVIEQISSQLVDCPHRTAEAYGVVTIFGWVGGVLTQTARDATAYVHRDMTLLWQVGAVWPPEAPATTGNDLSAWSREVASLIGAYTPNESYQNFPNREIDDWQQQYYAENLQRLVEVKSVYDPGNVFRNPQSIPVPRGS